MKGLICKLGCVLTLLVVCLSCSDEPRKEFKVKVVIEIGGEVEVRAYGVGEEGYAGVLFSRRLEREFIGTPSSPPIKVLCKEPDVLIRIKIWIDDTIAREVFGYKEVTSGCFLFNKVRCT